MYVFTTSPVTLDDLERLILATFEGPASALDAPNEADRAWREAARAYLERQAQEEPRP